MLFMAGTKYNASSIVCTLGAELVTNNNIPELSSWLSRVAEDDPAKAIGIVLKFGEFVLPKLQKTEITGNFTIEQFMQMPEDDRKSRIIALNEMIQKVS